MVRRLHSGKVFENHPLTSVALSLKSFRLRSDAARRVWITCKKASASLERGVFVIVCSARARTSLSVVARERSTVASRLSAAYSADFASYTALGTVLGSADTEASETEK